MQMTKPLNQRTVTELEAKAAELLSMSETARTADTRDALRRLAGRFAQLAESRRADQVGQCAKTGSWVLLRPADSGSQQPVNTGPRYLQG
jgi:transcription elongation GreA/GreB family factor